MTASPATTVSRTVRWSRLRTPLLVAAATLAVCAAVSLRDPHEPGSWLICPVLATTGFACPGCGALRAVYALTHGDLLTALARNPLLVCSLPVFVFVWLATVRRAWLGVPRQWSPGPRLLLFLPWLIGTYWVARIIPGFDFLGPGS